MTPAAKVGEPAVRAAFAELIDYAGLFPPAKLDMRPALAEYASERSSAFAWMLGRFIVPASRIPELLDSTAATPLALSVIVDAGAEPRTWLSRVQEHLTRIVQLRATEPRVSIEALEIALAPLQTQRETFDASIGQFAAALRQAGLNDLPAFVELPRDGRWHGELDSALFALSRHRLGAKLRCGGVTADAFPTVEEVAAFVFAAIGEHRLPMKATAGLHHPIRRRDESLGVMMHGFLNLLTAVARARAGADPSQLSDVLACEDADALGFSRLSVDDLRAVRSESFIAYGSCSFAEPVTDLQALGML